jgi:hypothetical protein
MSHKTISNSPAGQYDPTETSDLNGLSHPVIDPCETPSLFDIIPLRFDKRDVF